MTMPVSLAELPPERQALVARLREHRPHDVYRIARGGRLEPETDPAGVPHGTNWLCVPVEARGRLGWEARP